MNTNENLLISNETEGFKTKSDGNFKGNWIEGFSCNEKAIGDDIAV